MYNATDKPSPHKRLSSWLIKKANKTSDIHKLRAELRKYSLHTVCEEAKCPNIGECFCSGTATFMIMGDTCTRNCRFCAVKHGEPTPLDDSEPEHIAKLAKKLALKHVVVTSVTRDDLADGGAGHFVKTIEALRKFLSNSTIEILTPDFDCKEECIKLVCDAKPDIFNHNIETVRRLSSTVRSKATYDNSLAVLAIAKKHLTGGLVKSGIMIGMGETREEVIQTMKDLYNAGCQVLTIGQYLAPSLNNLPVFEYIKPPVFEEYKTLAKEIGFKYVFSAPYVRSSYMAHTVFEIRNTNIEIRNKHEYRNTKQL